MDYSGFGGMEAFHITKEYQDDVQEFADDLTEYVLARSNIARVDKMFKDVEQLCAAGSMDYGQALRWYYIKIIKKEFDI